ncbi:MAG: HD domain-containing phosphohydrolase [Desulfobacterales bacterium]
MHQAGNETILFVDDEESILEVSCEYFRRRGYRVATASNGLEAVKVLENQSIDCCFTDINMPGMDGLALAEHIHKSDNTLPVIIMTGYPSLDNTIQTLKNGVVDFLVKPVNLSQMELCVRRVISQRQLFVENLLLKKEVEGKERLENLNRELTVKVEEMHVLNRILSDFSVISSSGEVFKRLVDMAAEITLADRASFFIVNDAVKKPLVMAAVSRAPKGTAGDTAVSGAGDTRCAGAPSLDVPADLAHLIREVADDEIPLLVSDNDGNRNVPENLRSLMLVPLKIRKTVFGVLMAALEKDGAVFTEKDLYYLSFMAQNAANAIENLALYENIYENLFATFYAFVNAIEARDRYTRQHSSRVTAYSIEIGKAMGCSLEELDTLNFAGHLHDIGKIGIRDDILLKPGRLTDEEFAKIKEHPVIGAHIVEQLGFWERERQIIRCHHERYDGKGYPDGLCKEEIPLLGRILSVADVYDAVTSDRAYRRRMDESQAVKIIQEGSQTQFDPRVVEAFLKLHRQGCLGRLAAAGTAAHHFSHLRN